MPLDLEAPILAYFDLSNAHQAEGVAALFADDALVHDENADHRGRDAIRNWAASTYQRYGQALTPLDARDDGDATLVTAEVTGSFPGSPIQLQFRFVSRNGKISELRIG